MRDITLSLEHGKFNYRVGAIILSADSVLMVNNQGSPHYYSVGGRVQFGETMQEAVIREAYEETKIQLEIDRLVCVHENFFTSQAEQEPFHEMAFFYLMKANSRVLSQSFESIDEEYGKVSLHWLPIDSLESVHLYPEFFKTELAQLVSSAQLRHYITRDDITTRIL